MATVSLTGADTIVLNDRVFVDTADGDIAALSFPNDLANVKTGKNGNSIYAFNETGRQCEFKIRVVRASSDDKFLNSILTKMKSDFSAFTLITGVFVKRAGDGQGNITNDNYTVSGGIVKKNVEAKSNVEGDADQSVSEYTIHFANADRSLV